MKKEESRKEEMKVKIGLKKLKAIFSLRNERQSLLFLLCFLLHAICYLGCAGQPKSGAALISGGTLVWNDEFDGDSLDLAKWNIETGTGAQYGLEGWGNLEKEFYKPENVIVKNGCLILEARKDNDAANSGKGTFPYTSGKISTGGIMNHDGTKKPFKFAVLPGMRIEARLKSTRGVGLWPAFWMIGVTSNDLNGYKALGWPRCGEIDILEIKGGAETRLNSTIHFGSQWPDNRSESDYKELDKNMADEWHVIGVTWDANVMHFLVNGEPWYTVDLKQLHADNPKHFVKEAYSSARGFVININLATGGQYIGNKTPDDSIFGAGAPIEDRQFMIDWVRVYR